MELKNELVRRSCGISMYWYRIISSCTRYLLPLDLTTGCGRPAASSAEYCSASQRSERWMYRSAGPNWRIQVNSSEYMYLSGKRC
eukprot:COSAG02_NODE_55220_length_291_cov_2.322917_1_plen_84_part_10